MILQTDGDELQVLKPIENESFRKSEIGRNVERKFGLEDIYEAVEKSKATIYGIIPGIRLLGLPKQAQIERTQQTFKGFQQAARNRTIFATAPLPPIAASKIEVSMQHMIKQQATLASVALKSGGYTSFLETPEDADGIYTDILKVINNRYIIGYYSTNQDLSKKHRKVKVEIKGHPEFKILGKTSYVASEQ